MSDEAIVKAIANLKAHIQRQFNRVRVADREQVKLLLSDEAWIDPANPKRLQELLKLSEKLGRSAKRKQNTVTKLITKTFEPHDPSQAEANRAKSRARYERRAERIAAEEAERTAKLQALEDQVAREQAEHTATETDNSPTPEPVLFELAKINDLFDRAFSGVNNPEVNLLCCDGWVSLKPSRHRNVIGRNIIVSKTRKGSTSVVGRIAAGGAYESFIGDDIDLLTVLRRFAASPETVAAEFGLYTGECSFCQRRLSNGRSLSVGYGPICAGHWGLPYPH
jgi:hypothetical protein